MTAVIFTIGMRISRCEKASAYMLHNGFKNVFHLEGGIIIYFPVQLLLPAARNL